MKRGECEQKILELLEQIYNVCDQYCSGMTVSMCISRDGYRSAFAFDKEQNYLLNTTAFPDGTIRKTDDDINKEVYLWPQKADDVE